MLIILKIRIHFEKKCFFVELTNWLTCLFSSSRVLNKSCFLLITCRIKFLISSWFGFSGFSRLLRSSIGMLPSALLRAWSFIEHELEKELATELLKPTVSNGETLLLSAPWWLFWNWLVPSCWPVWYCFGCCWRFK